MGLDPMQDAVGGYVFNNGERVFLFAALDVAPARCCGLGSGP